MTSVPAHDWKDILSQRHETPNPSFFTHYVSQRVGAWLAVAAFQLRLSPNTLTLIGLILNLAACGLFALNAAKYWIAAGLFWQLAYAFDCADGRLARATHQTSRFGAWLDQACDNVREIGLSFTIVYVCVQAGMPILPVLAMCMLLACGNIIYLQTASSLKSSEYKALQFDSMGATLRFVLRNILDLSFFLFVLCALRNFPLALLVYVAVHGFTQVVRACALGYFRIKN